MSTLEFNQLLVSQSDFLRGFALGFTRNGADADDLVQDTMVKALRYKNNFKEGTNMKGWLYTIMRNIFINNYKRKKFQNTVLDSTENQYFINASQDYRVDTVTTVINQSDILEAIDELKPDFGSRSPCSSTATITMKSQRKWTFRWARSNRASSTPGRSSQYRWQISTERQIW